eukprot:CAMPEP_0113498542 /NCGR_PEP_ID=MMETSP0014_2-20120614/31235_1 /TAXON_ID=2857 /ORGANISM="Nitzschia sp." /LENGTH=1499 /DNA_ID=CAMNT_0000392587 /DNA_START=53 /DNA_END=4552 /DNA_ORIENTATION=- /assembly_acc=CAM_ASM_000159
MPSSGGGGSNASINALLKKTEHYDKDERYMATSDLCEVLKRHNSNNASNQSSGGGGDNTSTTNNASRSSTSSSSTSFFDATTERRICTAVLRLLHDKSNDVQAIAVKTLGVLLVTVKEELVLEIADSLADQVLDASKSELRDVYSIGLRTLVKTIPLPMGDKTSQRLIGRLLDGIRTSTSNLQKAAAEAAEAAASGSSDDNNTPGSAAAAAAPNKKLVSGNTDEDIILSCLDILTDLLGRFGASAVSVTRQHEPILQICLQLVSGSDNAGAESSNKKQKTTGSSSYFSSSSSSIPPAISAIVRKRAGNTIGCLSLVLNDSLLVSMVDRLLSQIEESIDGNIGNGKGTTGATAKATSTAAGDTRALIRTMCTVSGAVGHRLQQPQIDRTIPIFLQFTKPEEAVTGDDLDLDGDGNGDGHGDGNGNGDDDDMMNVDSSDYSGDDEAATALANELRENVFMGLESFVQKCPTQVEPHMPNIIQAALAYMSYDPNYSYGVDDDDDDDEHNNAGGGGEDDDDEEAMDDEYDDEEYDDYEDDEDDDDDDEDESWKVRRGAIRAIAAVIETKKHDPASLWTTEYNVRKGKSAIVAGALVTRFKEREENCRVGVLDAFNKLLDDTIGCAGAGVVQFYSDRSDGMEISSESNGAVVPSLDLQNTYTPKVVKACEKILSVKKGGERSKSASLQVLSTLSKAPNGVGGQAEITSVFNHVQQFLADSSSDGTGDYGKDTSSKALRLDALGLVVAMLTADTTSHDPVHIRKALSTSLLPQLCSAVQEKWYKIIAQALRALTAVPKFFVVGFIDGEESPDEKKRQMDDVAKRLYETVEPLLAAHDVDQEIKEGALAATASLMSNLHDNLSSEQKDRVLALLLERLKNDSTRVAAIKTMSAIAAAGESDEEKIDLSSILTDMIDSMAGFLKYQSRALKQNALEALDVVIICHGSSIPSDDSQKLFTTVLSELSNQVVDADLHMAHLSLRASVSVLKVCPASGPSVKDHMLRRVMTISTSPLLHDVALESLEAHLEQVVLSGAVEFDELFAMLQGRLDNPTSKTAVYNLAKCIAIITHAASDENRSRVIGEIVSSLDGSSTPDDPEQVKKVQLAILVAGNLGRLSPLPDDAKFLEIFLGYFDSPSEDVKNAAAYSLGRAAVKSQTLFLPAIVNAIEQDNEKKQYLLLSALRGFIQCSYQDSGGDAITSSLPVLMPHLEKHAADNEEGVRAMVAECLGSLTCMQPTLMLDKLSKLAEDHSVIASEGGKVDPADEVSKKNCNVLCTVASSIKNAITGKVDQLSAYMPRFVKLLQQEELSVRNAALLMVYSSVHHMPQLVSSLMRDEISPSLYEVAGLKMKRKVDLGPFSHTVDDALPLRKATFSIFSKCLESPILAPTMDMTTFVPVLTTALGDVEDIQLQAHQIVLGMCLRQSTYIVASIETFVEPLEKTMFKKAGQKTGTELERLHEWIKSALRTMVALSKVEGSMNSRKFAEFVERTRANSKFKVQLDAIYEEH